MTEIERHDFDVVIVGAGGAGLRGKGGAATGAERARGRFAAARAVCFG